MARSLFVPLMFTLFLSACASDPMPRATTAQKGAIIGATAGAVLGAAVGKDKRPRGALIGAIGGGLAGAAVGSYMDRQRQDLERVLAAERQSGAIDIDKLADNALRITMTAQTAFDVDSASVKPGFQSTIDKMADVVNKYGKTALTIVGHTDSTGPEAYNLALSEQRARSVQNEFMTRGVIPERLAAYGRGEVQPIASNATEQGKAQNRRVEIIVEPVVQG